MADPDASVRRHWQRACCENHVYHQPHLLDTALLKGFGTSFSASHGAALVYPLVDELLNVRVLNERFQGKPIARLVPIGTSPVRQLGRDVDVFTVPDDFDHPLPEEVLARLER